MISIYQNDMFTLKLKLTGRKLSVSSRALVDTGSPITLMSINQFSAMMRYSAVKLLRVMSKHSPLSFHGLSGPDFKVYPCIVYNVKIMGYNGTYLELPSIVIFVAAVEKCNNLIGLDFITACHSTIDYTTDMQFVDFDSNIYMNNVNRLCNNMNVINIEKEMQEQSSISDLLSKAEGS